MKCGYEKELQALKVKFAKLQAEIEELKRGMRIHAGDICSANNEAERALTDNTELETRNTELQAEKKQLQKVIEYIVTVLSVMANTTSEEGIRELPALAKELKSNTERALKEGE